MRQSDIITANNLLILQFIGIDLKQISNYEEGHAQDYIVEVPSRRFHWKAFGSPETIMKSLPLDMEYHKSFDWCMPVCYKWDTLSETEKWLNEDPEYEDMSDRLDAAAIMYDIDELYPVLVECVNWYNDRKLQYEHALESPALKVRCENHEDPSFNYPARFCNRVPLMVAPKVDVGSDLPHFIPGSQVSVKAKREYYVWVNSYGAVTAILPGGEKLGLKPHEFEVTQYHPKRKAEIA